MEYKLEQTCIDGQWEYTLYTKHYFWFGLFHEWHIQVYTQEFKQIEKYIKDYESQNNIK